MAIIRGDSWHKKCLISQFKADVSSKKWPSGFLDSILLPKPNFSKNFSNGFEFVEFGFFIKPNSSLPKTFSNDSTTNFSFNLLETKGKNKFWSRLLGLLKKKSSISWAFSLPNPFKFSRRFCKSEPETQSRKTSFTGKPKRPSCLKRSITSITR